jgi:hypothetical protein
MAILFSSIPGCPEAADSAFALAVSLTVSSIFRSPSRLIYVTLRLSLIYYDADVKIVKGFAAFTFFICPARLSMYGKDFNNHMQHAIMKSERQFINENKTCPAVNATGHQPITT